MVRARSLLLATVFTRAAAQEPASAAREPSPKISRWDHLRRGTNCVERPQRLRAARAAGLTLIRLGPDKWLNGRPERELGDFLPGPRDRFDGIPARDRSDPGRSQAQPGWTGRRGASLGSQVR